MGRFYLQRFPGRTTSNRPIFLCVILNLDRDAFSLPLTDGQLNLAEKAKIPASGIRDHDANRWGPALLLDNRGDTGWDSVRQSTRPGCNSISERFDGSASYLCRR